MNEFGNHTADELSEELTSEKAGVFLRALADYGNVSRAAEASGVSRQYWYRLRAEDEAFSRAWDKALAIGVEALEDEAKRRAYEGWEEPVWHKGTMCGAVRKFSDTLLIVLLKAHKPEKYQDRQKLDLNHNQPPKVEVFGRGGRIRAGRHHDQVQRDV